MPGCVFQDKWLSDDMYRIWICKEKCMNSAFCKLCQKSIDLSTMGKSALDSHAKGKKHKDMISTLCSEGQSRMQHFICPPMCSINPAYVFQQMFKDSAIAKNMSCGPSILCARIKRGFGYNAG